MIKLSPFWMAAAAGPLLAAGSLAQAAPGEDPVIINKPVTYLEFPTAPKAPSGTIQYNQDLPPGIAAKVGRYTADAYATTPGTDVKTDRDVVQSVKTNGLHTTCNQSVGSTFGGRTGAGLKPSGDQIVVLRGDMINICN